MSSLEPNDIVRRKDHPCWVCGSTHTQKVKPANYQSIDAKDFRITDAQYGVTADVYRCFECDFLFCPEMGDLLSFYAQMDDVEYQNTRTQRALQMRYLLRQAEIALSHNESPENLRLLDVGAGSGIMVEEAIKSGFEAVGLEPSQSLCSAAQEMQLPVINECFPSAQVTSQFDVITLVDIIEHVDNPKALLLQVQQQLKEGGVCLLVTPDVKSVVARVLGWRWWHFRVAHVGYFSRVNMQRLLEDCGLSVRVFRRPGWYFPADYLFERAMQYLPKAIRFSAPRFLKRFTVPLNLGDSLMFICAKSTTNKYE